MVYMVYMGRYRTAVLDETIVGSMAAHFSLSRQMQAEQLLQWDYDQTTAIYFLMLGRKQAGKSYQLLPAHKTRQDPLPDLVAAAPKRSILGELDKEENTNSLANSPRGLGTSLEGGLDDIALMNIGTPPSQKENAPEAFERVGNKNRASERYHIPHKKAVKDQQKSDMETDKENFVTPVATPRRSTKRVGEKDSVLSPSKSLDQGMNMAGTPGNKTGQNDYFATPAAKGQTTPSKSNKKVFGSLERGLDKMKNMLTPRRRLNSSEGPVTVTGKGLCNVSTTSHHNPDSVLNELTRALMFKGIACQQKGYILRGKITDPSGLAKLSFELEVVRIPNLNVVGIRRKRLKGDAWCYKRVCEEVLRMTAAGGHNT
jgi:maternal embryonic leucine zipper kinase